MDTLIWVGAFVSGLGLIGIVYCIVAATRSRKQGLDDAELRTQLQKLGAINLGALALSMIGLFMVIAGIFLG